MNKVCCLMALLAFTGAARADSITTLFNPNNSNNSFLLNVTNVSGDDVTIEGLFNLISSASVGTPVSIDVYTRPGTWVDHIDSSTGWSLLGSTTAFSAGSLIPISIDVGGTLSMEAGSTYGFWFYSPSILRYTNAESNGALPVYNDGVLQLDTFAGSGLPFGGGYIEGRTGNLTITYSATAVPEPATWSLCGVFMAYAILRYRKHRA